MNDADYLAREHGVETLRRNPCRSNHPGTCLWCGRTVTNASRVYFCTAACGDAFARAAVQSGARFPPTTKAQARAGIAAEKGRGR